MKIIVTTICHALICSIFVQCAPDPDPERQLQAYMEREKQRELSRGPKPSRDAVISKIRQHYSNNSIDPTTPIRLRSFGEVQKGTDYWSMQFQANGKNRFGGWTGWQLCEFVYKNNKYSIY